MGVMPMTASAIAENMLALLILVAGIVGFISPHLMLRLRQSSKWMRMDYADPSKFLYTFKYRNITVRVISMILIAISAIVLTR